MLSTAVAYAKLRDDILKGRRAPAERLVAQRVADELGCSRTPVKEALARLESERLVERAGQWGYSVRTMTLRDAEELFEARLVIEVPGAELAAERAETAEFDTMTRLLERSRSQLERRSLADFQHSSRAVHEAISQATGNSHLVRMFRQVNDLVLLFGISLLKARPQRASEILDENESIVAAVRARRGKEAGTLMRRHIEAGHASFRASAAAIRPSLRID